MTSRKYLRFCLKGRVFQFRALQFGLATSPFVITRLMVVIATHLRVRAIILFPYLDDWLVRNQRRLQLIKDREFTLRLISSLGLIINPEKSELIPSQNFTFIGMEFIRQYCPSSLGQSTMYSRPNRLVSETSCCHSKNVSLFTGETECFCSICRFRQTAPSPSSDGSFRSVETACSSTRTQNICYRTDKTSSGMVVGQGQIFTRSCSQTTSSSAHSLYRCELFGLGCSSGTGGTHVSWSLASEPISSTHQHPRNEGYSSSSQRVPTHSVQFLSNDSDRQFFCHGLSPKGGRHPFTNFMRRGLGNSPLVSREWNISQGQTHPGRTNILADRLSRSDKPISTEWSLNQSICNSIFLMSGHPNIVLFATRLNNRLPLFVSPIPDSKALAIDAMSMNWDGIHAYAFPPFHIIPAILTKIVAK